MSMLSFGYVCVLSCTRGQIDEPAETPQQAEEKAKLRRNLSRRASIVGIRIHDSEDPRVVARKKSKELKNPWTSTLPQKKSS